MSLPSLKSVIETHGLNAKKSLGQHFLLDENITAKIARVAGVKAEDIPRSSSDVSADLRRPKPNSDSREQNRLRTAKAEASAKAEAVAQINVIEIGPGPGGLTRALLAAGANVYAVEKDARCIAALEELSAHYPGKLHILQEDALKVDTPSLCPAPRKIVANLPYNVGTALLVKWLDEIGDWGLGIRDWDGASPKPNAQSPIPYTSLTLMFQREVALRIAAVPDTDDYGRLAVMSQWLCETQMQFDLPPGAFSPPPKVHSSVITLTPRPAPLFPADKKALERVLAAAFGQRRKMLRQALKPLGDAEALLASAGIDGTRRAETLNIEEFCALAAALNQNSHA